MMFYQSTTINSIHMSILYTPVNLKLKTPQNHLLLLLLNIHVDVDGKLTTQLYDKRDYSILQLSTSHIHVAIPKNL
jgi:hypothetical protein